MLHIIRHNQKIKTHLKCIYLNNDAAVLHLATTLSNEIPVNPFGSENSKPRSE